MIYEHLFFGGLCFVLLLKDASFLDNGLARTPPMGWMSWGYYMCATDCEKNPDRCLNEQLIMDVADKFFTEGYQEAGYEYIVVDDCWSERRRDENNRLVADRKRFPKGMKFLADYIHARGLKFGMYTNIADVTCMHYPGSKDHFRIDMESFAAWGADYVKVDGCFVETPYLDRAYIELGREMNRTGRPMVYSCSWPYYKKYLHKGKPDYTKIVPLCNLWRDYHDVAVNWGNVHAILHYYQHNANYSKQFHGPGHWFDPDMLMLGTNALTNGQSRIQMAIWSMLSAPLIISCDMNKISNYDRSLLLNLELISIAQDPMGFMAVPYKLQETVTLWVKPHLPKKADEYFSYSFAVVNLDQWTVPVHFYPKDFGLNCSEYSVMEVFTKTMLKNITLDEPLSADVDPDDVAMFTLFPI